MPTVHRRNVVIGPKTWDSLKEIAEKEERSISDILREAAIELINRRKTEPAGKTYNARVDTYVRRPSTPGS